MQRLQIWQGWSYKIKLMGNFFPNTSFIYKSKYKSALADNRRLQTQIASEEQQFAEEIKTALYPEGSPIRTCIRIFTPVLI